MSDINKTMKLNHLSFPSNDVAATARFFEDQPGCTVSAFGTSRLVKRPGFDIVIEDVGEEAVAWPRNFHLGFELPSLDDVQGLYQRFKAAGVEMETAVISHPRGSRFFCRAPGGVMFEINTRSDAAEAYRGTFDN
jgi:catechol 2,3-dioxygenase-like lactoylglutathione lyase family enzyme